MKFSFPNFQFPFFSNFFSLCSGWNKLTVNRVGKKTVLCVKEFFYRLLYLSLRDFRSFPQNGNQRARDEYSMNVVVNEIEICKNYMQLLTLSYFHAFHAYKKILNNCIILYSIFLFYTMLYIGISEVKNKFIDWYIY